MKNIDKKLFDSRFMTPLTGSDTPAQRRAKIAMIGLKNCEARNGFGNAQCLAQYRSEMGK
jgi:hypothetical protein